MNGITKPSSNKKPVSAIKLLSKLKAFSGEQLSFQLGFDFFANGIPTQSTNEVALLNMETVGVHDSDIKLLKDLFTQGNRYISFKRLTEGVEVSDEFFFLDRSDLLNPMPMFKCEGTINCSANTVVKAISNINGRRTLENTLYGSEPIDFINPGSIHTYAMSITKETHPLIWPLESVKFVVSNALLFDASTNTYYFVRKSLNSESKSLKQAESQTLAGMVYEGWLIREDPNTKMTTYMTVHCANVTKRGWGAVSNFWNRLYSNRAKMLDENLNLVVKDLNVFEDEQCIYKTLDVNTERLRERISAGFFSTPNSTDVAPIKPNCIKRIVYTSRFNGDVTEKDIREIERLSNENNAKKRITGTLICSGKVLYQVLEGNTTDIDDLYEKILKDKRHNNIQCVSEEFNLCEEDRQYPNWNMKAVDLDTYYSDFSTILQQFVKGDQIFDPDTATIF
ncbi:photoactivated adenylate cyclase subunit beta [Acrasis kona]|uniref:Photoactivated adenylate cyclase subunit beta n=1 Tax=Acrasis kona TaxID=1008807 RepID=A0AAW2ZL82_9EUKA